jgi:Holliday junction resolvase RusA-like endonuclease
MWRTVIHGEPEKQGSLVGFLAPRHPGFKATPIWKTIQAQLKGGHVRVVVIEEAKESLKRWRTLVKSAGEEIQKVAGSQLAVGPVQVEATVTLARPKSVKLLERLWPWMKGKDVDKLARAILDGLTMSQLYGDDSQVCRLTITKCYPDTPGVVDRLDHPGAVIRVGPIEDQPVKLAVSGRNGSVVIRRMERGRVQLTTESTTGNTISRTLQLDAASALQLARALEHEARAAERNEDQEVLV